MLIWIFRMAELSPGDEGGWDIALTVGGSDPAHIRVHLPHGLETDRLYPCRVVHVDEGLFKKRTEEVDEAEVRVKAWRPERSYLSLVFVGESEVRYEGYIKTR